jgi:solute:Na+ symporter, SSS family
VDENMNITAFILCLFGLQALCFYVGKKSAKGLKDKNDYFLAGKGVRFFPLMMTFLATQVGGGLILGSAEEAYHFGWPVLFYPLGATLGLVLLGLGLGRKMAQYQISTVAQIFEVVYRSPSLKKVASALSIISLFMILVAQIIASNKFMISLGVENKIWFIGFWAIVILYTALGGLKAVVATDIIQATFFAVVFLITFGMAAFSTDLPILSTGFTESDFAFSSSKLYGWLLMPLLFMIIEQDMGQRCLAAESPKTVSKATLWAAAGTLILSLIPVYFGVTARNLGIDIPAGSSVLMEVVKQTTTPLITALMATAILAAIISTADSLINAISSNISQDFNFSFLKNDKIRISQIISAGIAVAGIFFSFFFSNIVDLLIQSYELSVSCLFVPIFIALLKKEPGRTLSATLAVAFGALSFVVFRIVPIELPKELISVGLSLMGYFIGEAVAFKSFKDSKALDL